MRKRSKRRQFPILLSTLGDVENHLKMMGYDEAEIWPCLEEMKCMLDEDNFRHNRRTQVLAVTFPKPGFIRPERRRRFARTHRLVDESVAGAPLDHEKLTSYFVRLMGSRAGVCSRVFTSNGTPCQDAEEQIFIRPVPQLAFR